MFMNVHNGANKGVSNLTTIEYLEVGHNMTDNYYSAVFQSKKEFSTIPRPPKVILNNHNITDVQKSVYDTYRWENKDPGNPYRLLEECQEFSLLHDAISH